MRAGLRRLERSCAKVSFPWQLRRCRAFLTSSVRRGTTGGAEGAAAAMLVRHRHRAETIRMRWRRRRRRQWLGELRRGVRVVVMRWRRRRRSICGTCTCTGSCDARVSDVVIHRHGSVAEPS